ncbi:MAG TPA: YceI family protein [Thermoanaerobaculia bacterium]|jgi:polyisoprenoid-binding protein YceI|nr:YceI family protein [Thermoanaerobaculia bacterium]
MKRMLLLLALTLAELPGHSKTITIDRLDTNHSTVLFKVPIMTGMSEVTGKFTDFTIVIAYDEEDLTRCHVSAVIKTASVDTGIADRDKHLRTADFFDAEKFPEARFESSRIEKTADGFRALGTFTLRGVSKPFVIPFRITGKHRDDENKGTIFGFSGTAKLNRQDYGVRWKHSVDPAFVGDDVTIEIHLVTKLIRDAVAPAN